MGFFCRPIIAEDARSYEAKITVGISRQFSRHLRWWSNHEQNTNSTFQFDSTLSQLCLVYPCECVPLCVKVSKCSESFWKVLKGSERFWKVSKGFERFWKVSKGFERFEKVSKNSKCVLLDINRNYRSTTYIKLALCPQLLYQKGIKKPREAWLDVCMQS